MKKVIHFLTILLAVTFLATGCSSKKEDKDKSKEPGKEEPKPSDTKKVELKEIKEVEPNEKTAQAMEIKESCIVSGTLEAAAGPKKKAIDWYKIVPGLKKAIKISISGIAEEDLLLSFMDADKNDMFWVDSGKKGEGENFPNLIVENAVYMRVRGAAGGKGGDYKLSFEMSEPVSGQETEFNGRYSMADELKIGDQIKGYLGHQRDEDWYLLSLKDVPTGSVLRVELTEVENVRFALEILDTEERTPIHKVGSEKAGQGIVIRNLGVSGTPEAIFLVVKSGWVSGPKKKSIRTFNAEQTYSLSVSSEAGGDDLEREPNNSAKEAFLVLDGQKIRGYLGAPSDIDWYKIEVERPSLLSAELSALDRVDLRLSVVDPEKKEAKKGFALVRIDYGKVNEAEVLTNCALKAGENYVRIEGSWKQVDGKWVRDFVNLDETYTLTLNLRTDEGKEEREPNPEAAKATTINPGDTLRGTLHPKNDIDMFKLDLSGQDGPRDTIIECTGIPKLNISIKLLGPEKEADGKPKMIASSSKGKGDAKEQMQKELMPGEYFIIVRGSPRDESNKRDQYLLTVTQP
ncbi:MAG: hypothetical protein JRJ87_23485 [Deltaproteobacteria bacterium]|nr:hypothetical protein [Deltaproteobacteria bacterium]